MRLEEERARRPGVGLTSLIDVIFLLIVFFMLVSSFDRLQLLPLATGGSAESAPQAEPLILRLAADGGFAGGAEDEARIAAAIAAERPIVLRIGTGVAVQQGLDALDRLREAGAASAALQPEARQ
ncbi:hypothetical protein GCM10007285_31330 [Stappia taiwanensis]|uniref:ExbD/TolR family protein n=1 Tax=Stappia taiwanensis TaxID=992267 RepID=UPI00199DF568|nr:biopolymer transporter ExbD [Stappia taiwanensis]GGF01478.1 hypothetical protein GCM10007285_31330 [Stappia taiwanensis]